MRFAPQPCAQFFFAFWLPNVLRATAACTFSTPQRPKVLRRWGAFSPLTSTCASCRSDVQFLISHPTRWLRTRRFSEPTGPQNIRKTQCFATLLPCRSLWSSFFLLSLLSLFPPLLLHLVRSLISKFPSRINFPIFQWPGGHGLTHHGLKVKGLAKREIRLERERVESWLPDLPVSADDGWVNLGYFNAFSNTSHFCCRRGGYTTYIYRIQYIYILIHILFILYDMIWYYMIWYDMILYYFILYYIMVYYMIWY